MLDLLAFCTNQMREASGTVTIATGVDHGPPTSFPK
jgi:hypothetical protein